MQILLQTCNLTNITLALKQTNDIHGQMNLTPFEFGHEYQR